MRVHIVIIMKGYIEMVLKIGDIFDVTITKIGRLGDGIAHFEGYSFLIPDVNPEEKVQIEVTKCANNFGFCKVVKRLK